MSAGNEPDSKAGKYHRPPRHVIFALRYNWKAVRSQLHSLIIRERMPGEPPPSPIDIMTVSLILYLPATYRRHPLLFHLRAMIVEVLLESSQTDLIGLRNSSLFFPLQTQMLSQINGLFSASDRRVLTCLTPRGMFSVFFPLFSNYLQLCLYVFIVHLYIWPSSSLQVSEVKTSYCL